MLITLLLSFFIFFYLAGGFYSQIERLLTVYQILEEYEKESFLLMNIIIGFWIINSSKEMFSFDEPHVLLINKKKYIYSKIIAYYLFYFIICLTMFSLYQGVSIILYGFRKINYLVFLNLGLNMLLIHLLVLLIAGYNKNILFTIVLFLGYIILNGFYYLDYWLINIILFFYPFLNHLYPLYGYIHVLLTVFSLFVMVVYKHMTHIE